jgi:hypothetical protein
MLTLNSYPNTSFSPTSPSAQNNKKKIEPIFSGVGHEPDVFDYSISTNAKAAPKSNRRLDLQA